MTKSADNRITPMLAQYQAIKREHTDVILLFRLGDFYEMFGDDAVLAAELLNLTLTSREVGKGRRLPMCGVLYHAVERYVARLSPPGAAAIDRQRPALEQARAQQLRAGAWRRPERPPGSAVVG